VRTIIIIAYVGIGIAGCHHDHSSIYVPPHVDASDDTSSMTSDAAVGTNDASGPDHGITIESADALIVCDAADLRVCAPDGAVSRPLPGERIGVNGSATDAAYCTAGEYWYFPVESSSYCGSILEACQFVCGTYGGCIVGTLPNQPALQITYCPQDKDNPLVPHGP